jgi:arabinogalactan endo-1,4-beta-galactosidase
MIYIAEAGAQCVLSLTPGFSQVGPRPNTTRNGFNRFHIAGQTVQKGAIIAIALAAQLWESSANEVTFRVNMGVQAALANFDPASGDTVVVSGTFSATDWTTTSKLSADVADTNVYTGTFANDVPAGQFQEHKFVINPGGNSSSARLIWESGANRRFQISGADQTLPAVYFDNATNPPAPGTNILRDFIAGADMSHLLFFEDRGIQYRVDSQAGDALEILRDKGLNCVRLRLFTSSAEQARSNAYNYTNNLSYTLPLAVRAKNAGLKLLLDFHYSDSWADPGKQTKPAAWADMTFAELKSEIRSYSSNTIAAFKAAGAMPDLVQVGNEITPGLLWNDGRVGSAYDNQTQWSKLAQLLTNAIQGVKEASGTNQPKIMIHIDRGGDWAATKWFFDNLAAQDVDFDIIGQSYYPWWHGDFQALRRSLNNAAVRYRKPLMVVETGFPFANSTNVYGIPATTNGQAQYVVELAKVVKSVPGGLGAGVFWWGTEYQSLPGQPLAGFDRRSMFNTNGNVLPVAGVFGQMTAPLNISTQASNNILILKWPLSGAGMTLKSATNLTDSPWTSTTNSIQQNDTIFSTTALLEGGPRRFFRLEFP